MSIYQHAFDQGGVKFLAVVSELTPNIGPLSKISVLGLGLTFGLKHALDADHLAAVSTIVSERKNVLSSSMVGLFWGVGHTLTLLGAAIAVIFLHIEISARTAQVLELVVAFMLIGLGVNALRRLARGGTLHVHVHEHGGHVHLHPHIHHQAASVRAGTHHEWGMRARPLLVGMVHGLAGSAGLMLLVLSTMQSPFLGFLYVVVFGLGSIGGMLLMSMLVSLPVHLTAAYFNRVNLAVRTSAGLSSLGFGLFMVYRIGVVDRLFL